MTIGPIANAMADLISAQWAMDTYAAGHINKKQVLATSAIKFVECSAPWDEGGDVLCSVCMGKHLEKAIKQEIAAVAC